MLTAVTRQLKTFPPEMVATDARCELAKELARNFDAGHLAVTLQLNRVLSDLAKAAAAASRPARTAKEQPDAGPERTWVDELEERKRERLAAASDSERPALRHDRRAGGS